MAVGYNLGTIENAGAVLVTPSRVASSARNTRVQTKSIPALTPEQIEKFWSKVDKSAGPDGCWLWLGNRAVSGYGRIKFGERQFYAHRVAFALAFGDQHDGLTIDHVAARGCRHLHCVNPAHMEAVDYGTNSLRGHGWGASNKRKTHCVRGHEFTPENTWTSKSGSRFCRTCAAIRDAKYRVAA